MPRTFAIGDIHGCCETFKSLLLDKINIRLSDQVYCIGDYVDRGKNSKGVIDFILDLRSRGYHIHTLKGNHEQMMSHAFVSEEKLNHWLQNGGDKTLESFGISRINELPHKYQLFLKRTKYFITTEKYIFVHAGLDFTKENPFTDREAMLWTRNKYFDGSKIHHRLLIHGHTPITLNEILAQQSSYRINIDAGCVFNQIPGYGNLVALLLPDMEWLHIQNID